MDEQLLKIIDEAEWKRVQSMLSTDLTTLAEQAEKVVIKFDVDATNKQLKDGINIINQYNEVLSKQIELQHQVEKTSRNRIQLSMEEKVANQAQTQQQKLNAQATSDAVGAYRNLIAQLELAKKELLDLTAAGINSGSQFDAASLKVNNLKAEFDKIHAATGIVGKGFNNMAFTTLGFTQLLQDMPNFLISTRTGLMAISNNIPYALQGIENLAKSMIKVEDGMGGFIEKQAGYGYALKTMGKSLLSAQGAFIALSAVMLLFTNDKVVNMIKGLFNAEKQVDSFSAKMDALKSIMKDNTIKSTINEYARLGIILNKAKEGTYDADSAVSEYNKTLGIHYGKVQDVNSALIGYSKYGEDFIKSTIAMAASMKVLDNVSDSFIQKQQAKDQLTQISNLGELNNGYLKLVDTAKKTKNGMSDLYRLLNAPMSIYQYSQTGSAGILQMKDSATELEKEFRKLMNLPNAKEYVKQMAVVSKSNNDISKATKTATDIMNESSLKFTSNLDVNKNKFTQTAKEITITEEFYDKKRADIVEHMSQLELQSAKTTNEGVLNSYDSRRRAADEYYSTLKALADSDLKTAIDTATKKAENQTDEVNKTKADNLKKLNNQKITNAEYNKADKKLEDDLRIINNNKNVAIEKASAEHYKTIQDGERKHVATLTTIDKDVYEDQLYNLKISNEQRLELLNEYEKQRTDQLNRNTMSDAFLKQLGYEKDSEMDLLNLEKEINEKRLANDLQYIEAKLAITDYGSEKYKELIRKRDETVQAFSDERAEYEIKVENYITQKIYEYQEKIAEGTKTAINNLWESYWTVQSDNIDKQKDSYQKAEDEKLNVLEKAHDAGTLSDKSYNKQKEKIEEEYQKKQDALEAKDKKNKREALLLEQGVALAKVWINYFSTRMTYEAAQAGLIAALSTNPITAVGAVPAALAVYEPLKALLLKTAIVDSAGVAAQAIPYFNEGGIMEKTGIAMVGDNILWGGKRERELLIPPSGEISLTPDFPTLMKLEKGTHIIPDVEHIPSIDDIQRKIIVNSIFKSEKIEEKLDMIYNKIGNNKLSLMDKMMIKRYGKLS